MSLLNGTLALHDVPDVEGLCRAVVADCLHRTGAHLADDAYDDALAYLIGEAWIVSLRYDPARGLSFRSYAVGMLRFRFVDHLRSSLGRSHAGHAHRPRVEPFDPLDPAAWGDRLDQPVGEGDLDRSADRAPDGVRPVEGRGRKAPRDVAVQDLPAPRRARGGDPGAARAA